MDPKNRVIKGLPLTEQSQSVTCLATDASLTVDPGVTSSILAWSHTFVEIDRNDLYGHSPPSESFKKGFC